MTTKNNNNIHKEFKIMGTISGLCFIYYIKYKLWLQFEKQIWIELDLNTRY